MKAISLPSRGLSCQRANAPSTATRSCSGDIAKPCRCCNSAYSAARSTAWVWMISESMRATSRKLAK
jgi:hypothetical protein